MHGAGTDASGYRYFSDGPHGNAHALAHRAFDGGRLDAGRRTLGRWLSARTGRGSQWAHLQWHMAIFEVTTGRARDALARLKLHIVPAIISGDAATDGPSLLWWLVLAGVDAAELPLTRYAGHAHRLGGSVAQNRLFVRIAGLATARARDEGSGASRRAVS